MKSALVCITSAPSNPNLIRAFQIAQQLCAQGSAVAVFLAQDAVLAGLKPNDGENAPIVQALQTGIAAFALDEDLRLRGFAPDSLCDGVRAVDYAQLIDLFGQHECVVGAL